MQLVPALSYGFLREHLGLPHQGCQLVGCPWGVTQSRLFWVGVGWTHNLMVQLGYKTEFAHGQFGPNQLATGLTQYIKKLGFLILGKNQIFPFYDSPMKNLLLAMKDPWGFSASRFVFSNHDFSGLSLHPSRFISSSFDLYLFILRSFVSLDAFSGDWLILL